MLQLPMAPDPRGRPQQDFAAPLDGASRLPAAPNDRMSEGERQVAVGLGFCHNQINTLAQQIVEAGAEAGSLARVLVARGLITEEELAQQREAERERLEEVLHQEDFGIAISTEFPDKFAVAPESMPVIDCEARYHLCHGACCALRFALTTQDLDEAVLRWELGRPYLIRHGPDGRCVHQDRESLHCSVYEKRPGICRAYDCSEDSRIWSDFENRVINQKLFVRLPDGSLRPQFPESNKPQQSAADAAQAEN